MTEILYFTLIILLLTRIFGELAKRLGQTVLVGELISGVILGAGVSNFPEYFPILSHLEHNEVFHAFKEFGIFFLMLLAGMELEPKELLKASKRGGLIALFAIVSAVVFSGLLGHFFIPDSLENKRVYIFLLAIVTSITAVPILIKSLFDLDLMKKEFSKVLVSAAFFAEIMSLMLLTFILKLIETNTFPDSAGIFEIVGKVSVFFIVITLIGRFVFPIVGDLLKKVTADEFEFSALIIFAMIFSLISSILEMHFLIGAFMAGLFFEHSTVDKKTFDNLTAKVEGLTLGFFAPIFFASVGFAVDLSAITIVPAFISMLVVAFFISKLIGAYIASNYILDMKTGTSLLIGFGLTAKGTLDLIAVKLVKETGILDDTGVTVIDYMFSSIVLASVITTITFPIGMKIIQKRLKIGK